MVLKIDGTDIVPYIAYGGVKWRDQTWMEKGQGACWTVRWSVTAWRQKSVWM